MENKNIDPEDLIYLEEELTRGELTSLLFLLYGCEKSDWILQRLKHGNNKNFLFDFATHNPNWKTLVVEALIIAQLFEMIESLGIKSSDAREHLSNSSVTNRGQRLLFQLCEACSKATTEKLINHIKSQVGAANSCNDNSLEVFLLHAIAAKRIRVAQTLEFCDFSLITDFFSTNKCDEVQVVLSKFPKRSNLLDNVNNKSFCAVDLATSTKSLTIGEYKSKKLHALVINQQTFYKDTNPELQALLPVDPLKERSGTIQDTAALRSLFEGFGYKVKVKSDLTHDEILKAVKKAAQQASVGDGLIVSILSHGHEGVVYGHNSIPVRIKDVKKLMASSVLLGKTKILIIQACQGDSLQKEVVKKTVQQLENDGLRQVTYTSGSLYADFFTFWSTIEGFASVRHVDNGSWFIQELVKKIRELHKEQHLLDICTAVIYEVSQKRGYSNECMLPEFETTLTKKFRFPPLRGDSLC